MNAFAFSCVVKQFAATTIIIFSGIVALIWAYIQFLIIARIPLRSEGSSSGDATSLVNNTNHEATTRRLVEIYTAIYEGAESFLRAEYTVCFWFVLFFSIVVLVLVTWGTGWDIHRGLFTAISFLLGAATSMGSGYLGMKVAVFSNVRTTISAQKPGFTACFNTAFRAGAVMGFALCGLGILMLYLTLLAFRIYYKDPDTWIYLTESITGYGLGGSVIAMFGRVGGGIYTKAADVGADLVGKVVHGIPEGTSLFDHANLSCIRAPSRQSSSDCVSSVFFLLDDPRNPATIADNVGDNVGDVAGMGSDLFGSFAESTCAALVIGSSIGKSGGWDALVFPIVVSSVGIFVCLICSFIATHIRTVQVERHVEEALKLQLISTTVLMIPAIYFTAQYYLPAEFQLRATVGTSFLTLHPWQAWLCVVMGACGGLIIGLVTEYYTSHSYAPVRELANSCKTGAATNMIYGIALGYRSVIIPVIILAIVVYGSFTLCDLYGVALAAIGFLSNLATGLTIDVYGPVCDNAGGKVYYLASTDAGTFTSLHEPLFSFYQVLRKWPSLILVSARRQMLLMPPETQLLLSERALPLVPPLSCHLPCSAPLSRAFVSHRTTLCSPTELTCLSH